VCRNFSSRVDANEQPGILAIKPVPGGIRTHNLLIRSQKLYPVELQAQRNHFRFAIADLRMKPDWDYLSASSRRDSSGCEKIPTVQHGDDLAAREQFFEVIALAQFLIVEDAFPEGESGDAKFGLAKEIEGMLMR
jgi:hypothetical protein